MLIYKSFTKPIILLGIYTDNLQRSISQEISYIFDKFPGSISRIFVTCRHKNALLDKRV